MNNRVVSFLGVSKKVSLPFKKFPKYGVQKLSRKPGNYFHKPLKTLDI